MRGKLFQKRKSVLIELFPRRASFQSYEKTDRGGNV